MRRPTLLELALDHRAEFGVGPAAVEHPRINTPLFGIFERVFSRGDARPPARQVRAVRWRLERLHTLLYGSGGSQKVAAGEVDPRREWRVGRPLVPLGIDVLLEVRARNECVGGRRDGGGGGVRGEQCRAVRIEQGKVPVLAMFVIDVLCAERHDE